MAEIMREEFKADSVVKTTTSSEEGDTESFVTTFKPVDDGSDFESIKIKTGSEKFVYGNVVSIAINKTQKKLADYKKEKKEEDY